MYWVNEEILGQPYSMKRFTQKQDAINYADWWDDRVKAEGHPSRVFIVMDGLMVVFSTTERISHRLLS